MPKAKLPGIIAKSARGFVLRKRRTKQVSGRIKKLTISLLVLEANLQNAGIQHKLYLRAARAGRTGLRAAAEEAAKDEEEINAKIKQLERERRLFVSELEMLKAKRY